MWGPRNLGKDIYSRGGRRKKSKERYTFVWREIIEFSGALRHLSIISLKNFYLFKIIESVINFCLKKFSN